MNPLPQQNTIDHTLEKSGYFLQINHQNCRYEIRVNDFLAEKYTDPYPAYSVRPMINYEIVKSGKQTLSVRVTPYQGEVLSKNADIAIRMLRYPDMLDKENDFGGSTTMLEWEMPPITKDLPYFQWDSVFTAEVPYEIHDLDHAIDLREMDQSTLRDEVVEAYKNMHALILNDYDAFNVIHQPVFDRGKINKYLTDSFNKKVMENNKKNILKFKKNMQPIADYVLRLYGHGRVATLERLKDGGRIIWAKNPETGNQRLSLPLFIYKDKRDNQWHIW